MVIEVGDKVKYHIEFMEAGVCIEHGKVCKIKEGFFSKKYLVESDRVLFTNTIRARWIKENTILEIIEPIKGRV